LLVFIFAPLYFSGFLFAYSIPNSEKMLFRRGTPPNGGRQAMTRATAAAGRIAYQIGRHPALIRGGCSRSCIAPHQIGREARNERRAAAAVAFVGSFSNIARGFLSLSNYSAKVLLFFDICKFFEGKMQGARDYFFTLRAQK